MKTIVSTKDAPAAIGPYSQAVTASGNVTFCSGQIPLDPVTMKMVGDGDVQAQTRQVMKNLQAVIGAAGAEFTDIVRTTIFLKDMNDFSAVNEVYATFFPENPPARACVEVARLPRDVLVEIDAIAIRAPA